MTWEVIALPVVASAIAFSAGMAVGRRAQIRTLDSLHRWKFFRAGAAWAIRRESKKEMEKADETFLRLKTEIDRLL